MEQEMSAIWKTEIENTLTQLQKLREQLHPVAFSSDLWEEYTGAYGDVREDVAFLFCPEKLLPKMKKIIRLDFEEKSNAQINFDNLCENLSHQMSFYSATFLAMPYLVLLFEKKKQEQDLKWQYLIISQVGTILSTDIYSPDNYPSIPENILNSYQLGVTLFRKMTEEFLAQNMQLLQKEDDLSYFCTVLLGIFGDPKAASQLMIGSWAQAIVECPHCGYYDEDMEADGFYDEDLIKERIHPAASVIGKWDKRSYDDNYLWLSNLTDLFGLEEAWKVPYYYGTYTCPECGEKGILIDWMKQSDL